MISSSEQCQPVSISIIPPELDGKLEIIWDIGFFASNLIEVIQEEDPNLTDQFVEVNAYTDKKLLITSYLKEYQQLLTFLHNSKGDLKTLLGDFFFRINNGQGLNTKIELKKKVMFLSQKTK